MNIVEAREVNAAEGDDPIHWVLLTSWPCRTEQEVLRVVKAYTRRWLIEEYHKALKTGARIEESQLRTAQRIQTLLGILAVAAVRLLNRNLLGHDKELQAGVTGILDRGAFRLYSQWGRLSSVVVTEIDDFVLLRNCLE